MEINLLDYLDAGAVLLLALYASHMQRRESERRVEEAKEYAEQLRQDREQGRENRREFVGIVERNTNSLTQMAVAIAELTLLLRQRFERIDGGGGNDVA